MKAIISIIKKEMVLTISMVLAILSMFVIHPSKEYVSYIDFRTLGILFCMMVIMAGLQKLNIFQQLGESLIGIAPNGRVVVIILILLCFFLSMFITNDVALLTFVPFTVVVLHMAKLDRYFIIVICLETVAANLGSMLLPMGNPQNLFLFSLSGMGMGEFVLLMLPYAVLSLIIILVICFVAVKPEPAFLTIKHDFVRGKREKVKLTIYIVLFVISLLVVARLVDYRIAFVLVLVCVLACDWTTIVSVDYSLIFTFIFLFIFIGNMKQLPIVYDTLSKVVVNQELWVAIASSQVISNVPAAILLSGFTTNIDRLIVGTNLGGLGTLIASMASLISFKIYGVSQNADKKKYIVAFSIMNAGMLVILGVFDFFIVRL